MVGDNDEVSSVDDATDLVAAVKSFEAAFEWQNAKTADHERKTLR